jgi:beta-lactamase superfamily II metal-dependent hydrolase
LGGEHQYPRSFVLTGDADHMRGIKKIHEYFPVGRIWDSGHPGTTTNSSEYLEYPSELRRAIGSEEKKRQTYQDLGKTRLRYLSAKDERLEKNANAQGLVIKVEHWNGTGCGSSTILTGDCDAETWRYGIMKGLFCIGCECFNFDGGSPWINIILFDDPADTQQYYTAHMQAVKPAMTIISVGDNAHGHPDKKALELYDKYSTGSKQGNKVLYHTRQGDHEALS